MLPLNCRHPYSTSSIRIQGNYTFPVNHNIYPRSNSSLPEDRSRSPLFCRKGHKNERLRVSKSNLEVTETNISEGDVEPIKDTLDNKVRVRDSQNLIYSQCYLTVSFRRKPARMSS